MKGKEKERKQTIVGKKYEDSQKIFVAFEIVQTAIELCQKICV